MQSDKKLEIMEKTMRGISLHRNTRGVPVSATFDLKRYGYDLMPILIQNGVIEDEVQLSSKMKNRIREVRRGEFSELDIAEL